MGFYCPGIDLGLHSMKSSGGVEHAQCWVLLSWPSQRISTGEDLQEMKVVPLRLPCSDTHPVGECLRKALLCGLDKDSSCEEKLSEEV